VKADRRSAVPVPVNGRQLLVDLESLGEHPSSGVTHLIAAGNKNNVTNNDNNINIRMNAIILKYNNKKKRFNINVKYLHIWY